MTYTRYPQKFEVDTQGFRLQMKSISPFRVVQEIIANSFDQSEVTEINCQLTYNNNKVDVLITDNGNGFEDIDDAHTMFKYSQKRKDVEKRGRFNLGEKQFVVMSDYAKINTRNFEVVFDELGRSVEDNAPVFKGTSVFGTMEWDASVIPEIIKSLHKLIVPEGMRLTINDVPVSTKTPLVKFTGELWTMIEDEKTLVLRRAKRVSDIHLFEVKQDEDAWLFEMGVPVVKLQQEMQWSVNILQKIPQSTSRNVVTEAYLSELYGRILNGATDFITEENASHKWIQAGLKYGTTLAVQHVFRKQCGTDKVFILSTVDQRANELALENGYVPIPKGFISRETRDIIKNQGLMQVSTEMYNTEIVPSETIEPTEKLKTFSLIVKAIAVDTIGKDPTVEFVSSDADMLASWNRDIVRMQFNKKQLPPDFFDRFTPDVIGIIIHELAHDKIPENDAFAHYTKEYVEELERIGGIVGQFGIQYWIEKIEGQ